MTMIPTLGAAASFASSVLEHFKPSRAPYLLVVLIGAIVIWRTLEQNDMAREKQMLVIFPIFFFVLVLAILTFRYKPFDKDLLEKQELEADFDTQMKLARTTGLIAGISCLYIVAQTRQITDWIYWLLWSIILVHCITYLIYILARHIREESPSNKSYYQLSFMTSLCLLLLTVAGSEMPMANNSYLYDECVEAVAFNGAEKSNDVTRPKQTAIDREEKIDDFCRTNKAAIKLVLRKKFDIAEEGDIQFTIQESKISLHLITAVFFAAIWFIYIIFWMVQISRVRKKTTWTISISD